jgi:hypothetical protein
VGAAVAVSLGVGGIAVTNAAVSTGERAAFFPITPCRLFDTRPAPSQVGPRSAPLGPREVYTVQVTGATGNCTIPADATGVAMNVTTVGGTGASFLTVWPADVAQPQASNLNWVPGSPPTPNKVDVKLSATGAISLYNDAGSVSVLADVVGYYADHNHDDRYYTKAETTSDITMTNDVMFTANTNVPPGALQFFTGRSRATGGNGTIQLSLTGPKVLSGVTWGLKSVTYCIDLVTAPAIVTSVQVTGTNPLTNTTDATDRAADGCYTVAVNHGGPTGYFLAVNLAGGGGSVDFTGITTTWSPASLLAASVPESQPTGPETGL